MMRGFGPKRGGMVKKGFGPQEGRGMREEKREGIRNPVDDSTHGIEDMHDQDEKVE